MWDVAGVVLSALWGFVCAAFFAGEFGDLAELFFEADGAAVLAVGLDESAIRGDLLEVLVGVPGEGVARFAADEVGEVELAGFDAVGGEAGGGGVGGVVFPVGGGVRVDGDFFGGAAEEGLFDAEGDLHGLAAAAGKIFPFPDGAPVHGGDLADDDEAGCGDFFFERRRHFGSGRRGEGREEDQEGGGPAKGAPGEGGEERDEEAAHGV